MGGQASPNSKPAREQLVWLATNFGLVCAKPMSGLATNPGFERVGEIVQCARDLEALWPLRRVATLD